MHSASSSLPWFFFVHCGFDPHLIYTCLIGLDSIDCFLPTKTLFNFLKLNFHYVTNIIFPKLQAVGNWGDMNRKNDLQRPKGGRDKGLPLHCSKCISPVFHFINIVDTGNYPAIL